MSKNSVLFFNRSVLTLLSAIALTACGGGGGDAPAKSYTLPSVINAVPAQQ
jgi:hypothetical protein